MKLQSSLEFLLILGIVAGLAIGAVSFYNSTMPKSSNLINALTSPNLVNQSTLSIQKTSPPLFLFYAPSNSTTNMSDVLQIASIGCQSGSLSINFSSSGTSFSKNALQMGLNGTSFNSIYFTPLTNGYHAISILYNYSCDNQSASAQSTLFTFASQKSSMGNNSASYAVLSNRSEHIEYSLISAGNISSIKEFSHCTYSGPFGPAGIGGQCGTTNAWDYSVFSNYCYTQSTYYTLTYCLVPSQTPYSLSSPDPNNYSLNYSFNLDVITPTATLTSQISTNSSELMSNQKIVGRVNVTSVNMASQPPNLVILTNITSSSGIDSATYTAYIQAKNNLYSALSFYNRSEISPDLQSSIDSSLLAYSKASNALINGTKQGLKCNLLDSGYNCLAASPLYYTLKLYLEGIGVQNQTLTYQGSTIQLVSK
ncbi:MAG TPA: hypothetical protein VNF06_01210 [Candidatus Aquilonibacter sp.]|nr:hypothetical protein [Candidatus Aquilonibacter sp.]